MIFDFQLLGQCNFVSPLVYSVQGERLLRTKFVKNLNHRDCDKKSDKNQLELDEGDGIMPNIYTKAY